MYLIENSHLSLNFTHRQARFAFVEIKQRIFDFENDEFCADMALAPIKGKG